MTARAHTPTHTHANTHTHELRSQTHIQIHRKTDNAHTHTNKQTHTHTHAETKHIHTPTRARPQTSNPTATTKTNDHAIKGLKRGFGQLASTLRRPGLDCAASSAVVAFKLTSAAYKGVLASTLQRHAKFKRHKRTHVCARAF